MVIFAWDGGQVEADVIIERGAKYALDVSENAVETGYTIANSTLRKPIEITMKQAISPTNEGYGAGGEEMNGYFSKWESFWNAAQQYHRVFSIITPDYQYNDMVMTSCSKIRKNYTVEFDLTFRQVIVISATITTMPSSYKYLSDLVENKDDGTGRSVSDVYTNTNDQTEQDVSADAINAAKDSVLSPMSGIASIVKKVTDFFN